MNAPWQFKDVFSFYKHLTGNQQALRVSTKLLTRSDVNKSLEGTSFKLLESGRYNIISRNSFNRLPGLLANSEGLTKLIDVFDDAFAMSLALLTQNRYFILQKKA